MQKLCHGLKWPSDQIEAVTSFTFIEVYIKFPSMVYHFLLNGLNVEIASTKNISDELRDIFVTDIRKEIGDFKENLQSIVTAAWKAFIAELPEA